MFDQFPEPARGQLAAAFDEGKTRPEWCFTEGQARLAFWAPYRDADPVITWQLSPAPTPTSPPACCAAACRR